MSRSYRILLVEDDPDDLALDLRVLKQAGLDGDVAVARTGNEAIDYIFGTGPFVSRGAPAELDLVLLDLRLPGMDGLQVLQWIRASEKTRRLPVLVLSGSREDRDVAEAYRLGVQQYLVKPLEKDVLLQAVESAAAARS